MFSTLRCSKKLVNPTRLYATWDSSPRTVTVYCRWWASYFNNFSLGTMVNTPFIAAEGGKKNVHEGNSYHPQPHNHYSLLFCRHSDLQFSVVNTYVTPITDKESVGKKEQAKRGES
ncbi:hypothetical protein J3458_000630 [Metarhizium acridum]|uniref:uncharacterized protein n=1 Tax=Metarhizium acridum TaxID=92637 RepID=UPI001C6C3B49|nr:hypothetical protein J3458_000630 [Metarhizium acridum]